MSGDGGAADPHRLRGEVAAADNARVLRILRVVDALPVRGEADALIAPLRPRLAVLRPPRPPSLTRLLFQPLDPLIVPGPVWRPATPGVPRPLLAPLAAIVVAAMGASGTEAQARLARKATLTPPVALEVGDLMWPHAAAVLRAWHPTPAFAAATRIDAAALPAVVGAVAALLDHGATLCRLAQQPDAATDPGLAGMLLTSAARGGAAALQMMLALLLAHTPDAGHALRLAESLAPASLVDGALDFLLRGFAEATGGMSGDAAAMRRAAILLDAMERQGGRRPARAAKLAVVRRRLDGACRARLEAAADGLARLLPDGAGAVDDAEVAGMEAMALEARRLEALGRRGGGVGFDDAPLRRAAEHLAASAALAPVDRLRLTEILLGPDAALALGERAGFAPGG